jgi:2-dehydropantoate 2-reductase
MAGERNMKILVVGAGAIGGYFGGRLLEAGRDVTFLVRPGRAARLAETGLVIRSGCGDVTLAAPPTIQAGSVRDPVDLVLVSCKAYDLEGAIAAFAPAVGPDTVILPVLNGMRHLDRLGQQFRHVLGGLVLISSGLDPDGRILHFNTMQGLVYGERDGSRSGRVEAIAGEFAAARFDARLSVQILQDMWEKWIFIASMAGINCLMRGAAADLVAADGAGFALALLDECAAIAAHNGFPPSAASLDRTRSIITDPGSTITASMLKDMERNAPIEADQVIGDLLRRGDPQPGAQPMLRLALAHLKTYEARRARS